MSQSTAERPSPNLQRKAAIAHGGPVDHRGEARVAPIPDFALERTIFDTLQGPARYIMQARVGKEPCWSERAVHDIEAAYGSLDPARSLPPVSPALLRFLSEECNFDVEHADGSFLDHLYFGFEYAALYYPERSSLPMLLHSILGTGTNTFAMPKEKIPALRALLEESDWRHVEVFPSVLRLLYDLPLRRELRANVERLSQLRSIRLHRVIDNEPIELSRDDLFTQLNYQLIHFIDFLPVANWGRYASESAFVLFRDLHDLLGRAGRLEAKVHYTPSTASWFDAEFDGTAALVSALMPSGLSETMGAKQVRRFSQSIGHDLTYQLHWS